MMKTTAIASIASDVATLLGESLLPECSPAESPFPDIEDRVRILAPGVLESLILSSGREELREAAVALPGEVRIDSEGEATIACPDDFLRLFYIKMSDWHQPVTELTHLSDSLFLRQKSAWNGIRGNPERPVAVMDVSSVGKPVLKLYSSGSGARLETALYISRPAIKEGALSIPDPLYYPLVMKLSEIIRAT